MLKEGMYVRCPLDNEHPENPRMFILGEIININSFSHEVTVSFHDPHEMKSVYGVPSIENYSIDDVDHVEVQINSKVRVKSLSLDGTVINTSGETPDGYHNYYIQLYQDKNPSIVVIDESDLRIPFTQSNIHPLQQIKNYELHNPVWYKHRSIVSKSVHKLKNATYGFDTLLGSRVFLLVHQVDTIIRAIVEHPCRLMLADEVGLGKTIQAAVIKKGLEQRLGKLKTLFIAPESLVHQWKNEISYKFWEEIPVWKQGDTVSGNQLIFPQEKINTVQGKNILGMEWDLCIVDETHQYIRLEAEYELLLQLSKKVNHLLLLSATPIQSRKTEYLKLLCLLEPQKYTGMNEEQFDTLFQKHEYLSGKIHPLVRDLPEYHSDDLAEDYLDELEEISGRLGDSLLEDLVDAIECDSEDEGLEAVRLVLAYIAEHYQIDRRIIRHRRKELSDQLAERTLDVYSYPMRGAEVSYYEAEVYEMLLDYLQNISAVENTEQGVASYYRLFLSAFFSSPWAFEKVLNQRKAHLVHSKNGFIATKTVSLNDVISSVKSFTEEKEMLADLLLTCENWKLGVQDEFDRKQDLFDDPDLIKGRLMRVVDYVVQSVDEKFVIFSSWKETVLGLEPLFTELFGEEAVSVFYKGMTDEQLQHSVDRFQRDPQCRFILCDELGGEGRNFQMADELIHIDLPWSPTTLEQRIGRLDRIGRDKEVHSIVFYAEETLEEELFHLWEQGLGIFKESLSGLEIAIGDIQAEMNQSLVSNLRFGLSEVLERMNDFLGVMRKKVDQERYFDMARQLDKNVEEQLVLLIEQFDGENGKKLTDTMMSWAKLTGLHGSNVGNENIFVFLKERARINSMKKTMLIPPDMKQIHKRSKQNQKINGTFLRKYAVVREDLVFYAPGDPFFDAIVHNAYNSELGRSTAFYQKNSEIKWRGFVFTWNVSINPIPLLQAGFPIENLALAQGFIPLEPLITFHGLTEADDKVDTQLVQQEFWKPYVKHDTVHLGKRGDGTFDRFREKFPRDDWQKRVEEAYENSQQRVQEQIIKRIDTKRAKAEFQRRIDGIKAANLYYNRFDINHSMEQEKWAKIFQALQEGLESPKITLDSVALVWMEGNNG
ncbi:SNF2-related protein [Peribacillus sp. NPDC058075]|uniref:SNF2-related protein n=1 Tax=unclassified Peribacillus TaxID=2675266 RepID=UPI0036DF67DB